MKDTMRDLVAAKLVRKITSETGRVTYAPMEGVPVMRVGKENEILIFNLHKRRFHTCPWKPFEALEREVSYTKPVDVLSLN